MTLSEGCHAHLGDALCRAYDNNGNTLTKVVGSNTTTFAWDFENRLTSVTLPGSGGTVSFAYDPFGHRIKKVSSAGTSIFAYDGDNLIEETNASGTAVARYSQGLNIDEPLAMLRGGATSFYHADGLGSITSLTNGSGAIAQTYTFDSFGNQTGSSGSLTNPFRYTAREFDSETSLYYYRARYYDPQVGRFLREDPFRFRAGIDFYAYVNNQAPNLVDPFGLWPSLGDIKTILKKTWDNSKDAYEKGKEYAGKISCMGTYYYCLATTFANLDSISQASQGIPRYTPDELANPSQNEGASHEAHQVKQCISGNENCKKDLEDCLKDVLAGGILPH